ncbi:MAG: ribonucleoside-diphosphate reductase, adenosylcobalamin-dependent, partial [bacterium]|nr:ribonucleoside-diphosphate reductase, adenosylcobalamin-dependent [bacterium]
VNHNEGKPFEVFIANGKSGSDVSAMADALGRMISIMLRVAGPVPARERLRKIVSELAGLGGSRSVGFGENKVRSLPDAVAKVLAKYAGFRVNGRVEDKDIVANGNGIVDKLTNGHAINGIVKSEPQIDEEAPAVSQLSLNQAAQVGSATHLFDICPECGAGSLAYEEGCQKCYGCGYSAC